MITQLWNVILITSVKTSTVSLGITWDVPSQQKRIGKVTKCLSTAPGLIGSLYSPGRVRVSPWLNTTITPIICQQHILAKDIHISLPVHSVSGYRPHSIKRVNRYFTPFLTLHSTFTHSDPSDKMTCHRQLIFRPSLRSFGLDQGSSLRATTIRINQPCVNKDSLRNNDI